MTNRSFEINHVSGLAGSSQADMGTTFYHGDHLGSARLMTGYYGYPIWSATYLPYGYEMDPQIGVNNKKFTGMEGDSATEGGMDHTQFRQYASIMGRWLTPDPGGLAVVDPFNPQSWNRYAYVNNNPLNAVDPLGLYCLKGQCPDPEAPPPDPNWPPDPDPCVLYGCGFPNIPGTDPPQPTEVDSKPPRLERRNNTNNVCMRPTAAQQRLIAILGTAATFWNKTIGLGLGVSGGAGNVVGVSTTFSKQIVVSPNGRAAFVTTISDVQAYPFNAVVSPGAGGYGGFQYSFSNAQSPQDLSGTGIDYGFGGGAGLGAGVDLSVGTGTQGQTVGQVTVTVGGGAGGYGHGLTPTRTFLTPICTN